MMFTVYVLYSPTYDKIYIGYTSDLEGRLLSHNTLGKKGWTVRYRPWDLLYTEEFSSKSEATGREQELKSARGRDMIWGLVRSKYGV